MWTQEEAIEFAATLIEPYARANEYHVALTGGTLYKKGPRKDVDIVLYSHQQRDKGDRNKFEYSIRTYLPGMVLSPHTGRVTKAKYNGKAVDFIYPEEDGEYEPEFDL